MRENTVINEVIRRPESDTSFRKYEQRNGDGLVIFEDTRMTDEPTRSQTGPQEITPEGETSKLRDGWKTQ